METINNSLPSVSTYQQILYPHIKTTTDEGYLGGNIILYTLGLW